MRALSTNSWSAKEYAQHSSQQKKWAQELMETISLQDGMSVLDIGCGDGFITAEIASRIPEGHVVGIDSSPDMIAYAESHYPSEKYPNLSFMLMDAQQITFKEVFDVVFSNAVLHWVKDHLAVMQGVAAALKPGGKLLFQMGGKGNAAEIIAAHEKVKNHPKWRHYFEGFELPYAFLGVEDYQALLKKVGLIAQEVKLIEKDMQHAGKEAFSGWIRTTWMPYAERVPISVKEDFIKEVVDTYLEKFPLDKEGIVHVKMVRLQVQASKPR